ncbi:MAG: type II secretion system minor pseudopilin GspI [Burkholderiales bacterium]
MRARAARGFTLIEVLVALAVLAIALAAVMRTMSQSIDLAGDLGERTAALWVAQNRLALHQIRHDWPAQDTSDGTADLAGRAWRWREQVSATPDASVRRIEIEVRADAGSDVLARLVGFLAQPAGAV